jgi:ferric-dicitrate binding protein FerR (iron transport regulator)
VDGTIRVERGAATAEDLAWTRGRLVFRDAPIDEVTLELRRWYGIDLLVTGPVLRGRRLTATFDRSNAPDVGRVIAAALGGVARQTGETLWVDPVHKGLPRR